jgi:N-acetylated-alpha-linked acidic dipeptidase
MRRVFPLLCVTLVFTTAIDSQQPQPLRGFSRDSAAPQRELERRFQTLPKADNLREYMRVISQEPHHAGTAASRKVAEYVLAHFRSWGLNASIEEYEALMPYPVDRIVELVDPERYSAQLNEPNVAVDEDSNDAGQLPTFNAYSADGDVAADLVYVNYGVPEDYEQLAKLGVDVEGKVVIARYGRSWRGIKPKVAWEHGAVGCIIYSDPRDDGFYQGDVYPKGAYRPEQGVQRGSVMDMPIYPGDPLTPGWASERGARKLERAEARTLLRIPVLPISYGDALPLLRNLTGPVPPESWRGALPITYHVGPGPARVRMKLSFDWQIRPLYNVIARIDGTESPDAWILYGNHHDAWVNGASDPTSGNVVLMETARGLAELVRTGWKPKRTIILASWDGEEWGLLGSTEWVEKHQDELARNAVAYINSDSTGKGWLTMEGSHSLQAFVNDVARDVPDPRGRDRNVLEAKRAHDLEQASSKEARAKLERGDLPLAALGSGSDYTAFLDHLNIASLNLSFGGDGSSNGVYHSIYDSFYWYSHFSDGDFKHSVALSKVIGTMLLRLANADVLPFEFRSTASTLHGYVDELDKLAPEQGQKIDFGPLRTSIAKLDDAAQKYDAAIQRVQTGGTLKDLREIGELNRVLYSSERAFRYDAGLPRREWFKHLAYAPGFYTGYGVKTLPGIREAIEQKQWDEARRFVPIVAAAIDRLRADVEKALALIKAESRSQKLERTRAAPERRAPTRHASELPSHRATGTF